MPPLGPISNAYGDVPDYVAITPVNKTGTLASSAVTADQVIVTYTVTSGKTFYLTGLAISVGLTTMAATASFFGTLSLENPSGTKLLTFDMRAGQGATGTVPINLPNPIACPGGTVVRLVCTPSAATAFTWNGNLTGYER